MSPETLRFYRNLLSLEEGGVPPARGGPCAPTAEHVAEQVPAGTWPSCWRHLEERAT